MQLGLQQVVVTVARRRMQLRGRTSQQCCRLSETTPNGWSLSSAGESLTLQSYPSTFWPCCACREASFPKRDSLQQGQKALRCAPLSARSRFLLCIPLCSPEGVLQSKASATRAGVFYNQQALNSIARSQEKELGMPELGVTGVGSAATATGGQAGQGSEEAKASQSQAHAREDASEGKATVDDASAKADPMASRRVLPPPATVPEAPLRSSAEHFHKVKITLAMLVRDWSQEGLLEREHVYGPLLAELDKHLPVTDANRNMQRVLVPGCGLGRLAFDIAARGYATQGNDASYFMLFSSNFILNSVTAPLSLTLYPWLHDTGNHFKPGDMLRPVAVPDIAPSDILSTNPQLNLSMTSGDFLELYGTGEGTWDAVVTCFFLDTAPVALEYVTTIHRLLRPGGVWINLGPLLYHWASHVGAGDGEALGGGTGGVGGGTQSPSGYERSLELSYFELRHAIVAAGFDMVSEGTRLCTYTANLHSMMKTVYTAVLFTAVKSDRPPATATAPDLAPPGSAPPRLATRHPSVSSAASAGAIAAGAEEEDGHGRSTPAPEEEGEGGPGAVHGVARVVDADGDVTL